MTLRDLIIELQDLAEEHGQFITVRVNHELTMEPEYVPETGGCSEYISLTSV